MVQTRIRFGSSLRRTIARDFRPRTVQELKRSEFMRLLDNSSAVDHRVSGGNEPQLENRGNREVILAQLVMGAGRTPLIFVNSHS